MAQGISNNLTAFILAAGIGSRLGKITQEKPKALVEVGNKPMIDVLVEKLINQGFANFVVNLHHHAGLLKNYLTDKYPNLSINFSDETVELLDTGGAIKHAQHLLPSSESFLVHNVDVILPCNPLEILERHNSENALMTLAVSDRKSTRKLLFDHNNRLCGWTNSETGEIRKAKNFSEKHRALAYSGVQWISPKYFNLENTTGRFSVIDSWLSICHLKPIIAFEHQEDGWFDLGSESKIKDAEMKMSNE